MDKLKDGALKWGLKLNPLQLTQFQDYYRELLEWNQRINLTRITGHEEVQLKHFLDSLSVSLAIKEFPDGLKVIDVGSGAGVPGIPLKIAYPQIRLVTLDSVAKKNLFITHLAQTLGLDIEIVTGRAEEIAREPQYREQFSVVLSRAVASLPTLAELTLPFLRENGIFIAQKKGELKAELAAAATAIKKLGGKVDDEIKVDIHGLADQRYLIVIRKVHPTPAGYPRRPGMPAKRPL